MGPTKKVDLKVVVTIDLDEYATRPTSKSLEDDLVIEITDLLISETVEEWDGVEGVEVSAIDSA